MTEHRKVSSPNLLKKFKKCINHTFPSTLNRSYNSEFIWKIRTTRESSFLWNTGIPSALKQNSVYRQSFTKPRREGNFLKKLVHGPTSWSGTILRARCPWNHWRTCSVKEPGKRSEGNERVLSPWYQRRMCSVIFKLGEDFAPRSFRNGGECCPMSSETCSE